MKTLQEEAENYRKTTTNQMYGDELGFIAGATSDYVKAEKIRFAIEQLKKVKIAISDKNVFTLYNISNQIRELELQLKSLENGK